MLTSFAITSLLALAPAPEAPARAAESNEAECVLRPTYGTPVLLGDVTKQSIVLTGSEECAFSQGDAVLFVNSTDNKHRSLASIKKEGENEFIIVVLSSIAVSDDPTKVISSAWNVFADESEMTAGGKAIAQVFITPVPVVLKPKTTVVYRDDVLTEIASQAKPPGVAYVVPNGAGRDESSPPLKNGSPNALVCGDASRTAA